MLRAIDLFFFYAFPAYQWIAYALGYLFGLRPGALANVAIIACVSVYVLNAWAEIRRLESFWESLPQWFNLAFLPIALLVYLQLGDQQLRRAPGERNPLQESFYHRVLRLVLVFTLALFLPTFITSNFAEIWWQPVGFFGMVSHAYFVSCHEIPPWWHGRGKSAAA